MKDNRLEHKIDFDKLNKIFENYECDGQLSFMFEGKNIKIVDSTLNKEVNKDKVT